MGDNENNLLKWGFLLLTVLIVLWAFWRILEYSPKDRSVKKPPIVYTGNLLDEDEEYTPEEAIQALKLREFLETQPSPSHPSKQTPSQPTIATPSSHPAGAVPVVPPSVPVKKDISAIPSPKNNPVPNEKKSEKKPILPVPSVPVAPGTPVVLANAPVSTPSVGTAPQTARTPGYGRTREEALAQQRKRMLAPHLIPDKKTQQDIEDAMGTLSNDITRTANRMVKPISKKEEKIEKYLNRSPSRKTTKKADPFEEVVQQVRAQKENIVGTMRKAFGEQIGNRAGELMDAFQQEIENTMSNPELSAEQKAERAQKISNKYQRKLNRLTQHGQYELFVAERLEKDKKYKEELAQAYPDNPDFCEAANQLIDKARERDLELALHPEMAEESYFKTQQSNQYQDQKDLDKLANRYGVSTVPLHKIQNQAGQDEINTLKQLEEKGEINSYKFVYASDDIRHRQKLLDEERAGILEPFKQTFSREDTARVKNLLEEYKSKIIESMRKPATIKDHAEAEEKIHNEYNRKLLKLQIEVLEKSDFPQEEKEQRIQHLREEIAAIPQETSHIIGMGD